MANDASLPSASAVLAGSLLPSHPYYNWFLRVDRAVRSGVLSVEEANSLIASVVARVQALEDGGTAADLLAVMYGTNGINVYGNLADGVEIRGPDLNAIAQRIGPPGRDGEDGADSWVPGPPGPPGPQGPAGASGSGGGAGVAFITETIVEEAWPIPGPKGDTGASGGGGGGGSTYAYTPVTTLTSLVGAAIPYDNTTPQIGEGVEFTALATTVTPASASDVMMVEVVLPTVTATGSVTIMAALFRDAGASAVATAFTAPASASYSNAMVLRYIFTAGSTSPTTFRLRMGGSSSTTIRVNGEGTIGLGGTIPATMTIHKIA